MRNNFLEILSFFIYPAIIFFLNFILYFSSNIYSVLPSFDIAMHFLGGFSIALTGGLFIDFFERKNHIKINSKVLFVFVVLCFVISVAVLWEFWEYVMKFFFNLPWQVTLADTLKDILVGLIGGIFGSIFFTRFKFD